MKNAISKILKEVVEQPSRKEKVAMLQKHDNAALRKFLAVALDDTIEWALPEGTPKYRVQNDLVDQDGVLYRELRRLYLFTKNGNPNLKQERREKMFIQLLETVDPSDAEMLIALKDGKFKSTFKGITLKLVNEAYPQPSSGFGWFL